MGRPVIGGKPAVAAAVGKVMLRTNGCGAPTASHGGLG